MAQPPDADEANPFAAPESTELGGFHIERVRPARSTDFVQLAFQFKFFGGLGLLLGFFVLLLSGPWWLELAFLFGGAAFLATGFGIAAYNPWAWYAAAVLIVPMLLLAAYLGLLFGLNFGRAFSVIFALAALIITPLYCGYIGWILFSRAGRQRYQAGARTMAAMRNNPDGAAARLRRRR